MADSRMADELRVCANPACDQAITGRPNKLTCGPRCRTAYRRHRDKVLCEAETQLQAIGESAVRDALGRDPELARLLEDAVEAWMRSRGVYESLSRRHVDPRIRRVSTRRTPGLPPDYSDGDRRRRAW